MTPSTIKKRKEIVADLLVAASEHSPTREVWREIADFADALYTECKFDSWVAVMANPVRLLDELVKRGVMRDWTAEDNTRSAEFRALGTKPPPVVLFLTASRADAGVIVLDGRHRLVAAKHRDLVEVLVPAAQVLAFGQLLTEE